MFGRKKTSGPADGGRETSGSERTLTNDVEPTKAQIKRATRTRFYWALLSSFLLLISVIFTILVEIGDIKPRQAYSSIYFININLADIIPVSVPNAVLINSIAQSLGLHDFYTVGLWGFCQGYNGQGTTECSTPQTLYWFNPVDIIKSQLLSGAKIALPAQIDDILHLIQLVSFWMFGLFLAGACVNFVMIFLSPLIVFSRWATLPLMIITFLGALFTVVASIIATVMFIIMKNVITSATAINIHAEIGIKMFAFMWTAAAAAFLAWMIQLCLLCCCASRRDVRRGKKRGSKKAWNSGTVAAAPADVNEKPARRRFLGRKSEA